MSPSSVEALTARRLDLPLPLNREDLERAQMAALRQTVIHVQAKSPWYRERLAGLDPADLKTPADLTRLPLMSSTDVGEHGLRMVCAPQRDVARIITLQTSGSTGAPKRLHFTATDLEATLDFFLHGMFSLVTPSDAVLALLPHAQPDSTGDLLIRALAKGGLRCQGMWPPENFAHCADEIQCEGFTCVVGLPQHLLALAHELPFGQVRTMLLCSDYAPPALRARIEALCGCETFLHYGATETGLGGGVECAAHDGCHLRESELLVEIVSPKTGAPLAHGELGEVVVTTLGRQAMPLLRYRTGDLARLATTACVCGGITARLRDIRGRSLILTLSDGSALSSQMLDDALFAVDGLTDYRAAVIQNDIHWLEIEFLSRPDRENTETAIRLATEGIPSIARALAMGHLQVATRRVDFFSPSHTAKRTLLDKRGQVT